MTGKPDTWTSSKQFPLWAARQSSAGAENETWGIPVITNHGERLFTSRRSGGWRPGHPLVWRYGGLGIPSSNDWKSSPKLSSEKRPQWAQVHNHLGWMVGLHTSCLSAGFVPRLPKHSPAESIGGWMMNELRIPTYIIFSDIKSLEKRQNFTFLYQEDSIWLHWARLLNSTPLHQKRMGVQPDNVNLGNVGSSRFSMRILSVMIFN